MAKNKIVFGNEVLIDLTDSTVDAAHLLEGSTAYDKHGELIDGECTYNADTSDATAGQAEILATKTAYVAGAKLTGTMPNIGSQTGSISTKNGTVAISQGYHDGGGSVGLATSEKNKLIAGNIKAGIVLFGITGDYSGETVTAQAKSATPTRSSQVITPDTGYDYLSQVTVAAIPYVETANAFGTTVTIG